MRTVAAIIERLGSGRTVGGFRGCLAVFVLLACWNPKVFAADGSISGTVKTSAGKPLRANIVVHDLSTERVVGRTPFDRQFASSRDGSFSLAGIPAGTYELCVNSTAERVLDPCVWSAAAVKVTVVSGQALRGVDVTVDTGVFLQIRVNDPQKLLPEARGGVAGESLKIGIVRADKKFLHARAVSIDDAGRNHLLVVPAKENFDLVASSSKFTLTDDKGDKKANEDSRQTMQAANGQDLPVVTFSVSKP